MTDRQRPRVLIFIVAYEAEATIESVLRRIPGALAADYDVEILVIDDASTDRTFALVQAMQLAAELPFRLHALANPQNQGYGGNQKIGFRFALDRGFDIVALVHGDGQYAPESLPALLQPLANGEADAVMGSRMIDRYGALKGGMPFYKFVGNRILTRLQNRLLRAKLSEYHSGYRLYSTAALRRIPFELNASGFHFDTETIVQLLIAGQRIRELPIPTRYGDEISRVNGVRYAWNVLTTTIVARLQEVGLFYDRRFDCRPDGAEERLDAPRLAYDSAHVVALSFVKPGARVLLIGRGSRFGAELRERGCEVVTIALSLPGAISPDADGLPASLQDFNLVFLLDGIDRVRDPELFVDRLRHAARLAPHVMFVICSANVGFVVTRLMLLLGQFNYGERGILDRTHCRLFTLRTLWRLLDQGGFTVIATRGVPVPFPLVFGDGLRARLLLRLNGMLLRLSTSLFAYQIAAIAKPRLSLEYLLAQAELQSRGLAASLVPEQPSAESSSADVSGPPSGPEFRLHPVLPLPGAVARAGGGGRRLICVSHLPPHPPRAGAEYRMLRMLRWFSTRGWEVLLVVCPLPYDDVGEDHVRAMAAEFPNVIVCRHDGMLQHHLAWEGHALEKLDRRRVRNFASMLDESDCGDERLQWLLKMKRYLCPDILVELLLHLDERFEPEIMLAEYAFQTRPFRLLRPQSRKIVDTLDVFSNKRKKVMAYGIADTLPLTEDEEARLLSRADLLIAIQEQEAADLRRLVPHVPVVRAGVDFDLPDRVPPPATRPVIVCVGFANPMNVKGLRDFLRFAWPLVQRDVPDAELRIIGSVGSKVEVSSSGVRILGRVGDLAKHYAEARLTINPSVAGTGLKIKTIEALCHLRPIVLWPAGVEGIDMELQSECHVATDWYDFACRVIRILRGADGNFDMIQQRDALARHVDPAKVYAALAQALDARPDGAVTVGHGSSA